MPNYSKDCACGETHTGEKHQVDALCEYHAKEQCDETDDINEEEVDEE